ncbi:uncharacterized protein LOC123672362 [Harmonia axyridis]|uniref:uncharacterized protein LOC123672362 n=1 Tax=Harmonia axyridis TaxID=115357 RepID=UPI001E2757A4|nr:uncharacterized protein LOC123672362 [Harmonia axyridis]
MNEFLDLLDEERKFETEEYCDFRAYLGKVGDGGSWLAVIHFNIRSINKKLTIYLDEFKNHVDVIILSETWKIESNNQPWQNTIHIHEKDCVCSININCYREDRNDQVYWGNCGSAYEMG